MLRTKMDRKLMWKGTAIGLLTMSLFAGCATEDQDLTPDSAIEKGDGTVTVILNIPSPLTVDTYVMEMNTKMESEIDDIDVLVFDPAGRFLYRQIGTDITDGTTNTKKEFAMNIKRTASPNKVTALVYANVRAQIDAATHQSTGWITASSTKNEVINELTFDLPKDKTSEDQGGKWLVLPGRYTHFPMWGQTETIDLTQNVISIPEVNMLRAVAKIDVGLNFPRTGTPAEQDDAAGLSNFFLEEVYLYNAYDKLQVAPTAANLSGTVVTAPSLPVDKAVFGSADSPIEYTRRTYDVDGYKSFMNGIYLAEHDAGSDDNRANNPCIVVGGRFGSVTNAITYYRIDMVHSTIDENGVVTAQKYLPLLRNHRYKVNITSVRGRGYDTAKEAFQAMGLNTNLTVVVTSQDDRINEVVYDGQYTLGADRTSINVDKKESIVKELYVMTDYPGGWKATVNAEASEWLFLDKATGANGGSVLKYHTMANETPNAVTRSGIITVQAGRLLMDIRIKQSHRADIEFFNVSRDYVMDRNICIFKVLSLYDWKVKVEDEYNIITRFDASGVKSEQKTTYNFQLVNDVVKNVLKDKTAILTFYSETGEFEPATVTIHGVSTFVTFGNVEIYPYDQPTGERWYTYANIQHAYNTDYVQKPGANEQFVVSRSKSCASIPGLTEERAWRLPTNKEMLAIAADLRNTPGAFEYHNFLSNDFYWTANSLNLDKNFNAYCVKLDDSQIKFSDKMRFDINARCVRSK